METSTAVDILDLPPPEEETYTKYKSCKSKRLPLNESPTHYKNKQEYKCMDEVYDKTDVQDIGIYSRTKIYDVMEFLIGSGGFQELTVTFNNKRYGTSDDKELKTIVSRMLQTCGIAKYLLIPCITDNNMLHYHGVIKSTRETVKKFQHQMIYSHGCTKSNPFVGYTKVSYIRDNEKYFSYIKDSHQRSNEFTDFEFSQLTIGMKFMDNLIKS